MKSIYIVGGIIVVIIVAIVAFLLLAPKQDSNVDQSGQSDKQIPADNQSITVGEETVETIELTAVGNYTGSGVANRSFNETNFIHLVTAKLGPPAEGKFYEGWLVKGGVPVSTGKMTAEGGDYVLLFTSDTDYSDHNKVVITEETESLGLDGKPETHVLEGSFQAI